MRSPKEDTRSATSQEAAKGIKIYYGNLFYSSSKYIESHSANLEAFVCMSSKTFCNCSHQFVDISPDLFRDNSVSVTISITVEESITLLYLLPGARDKDARPKVRHPAPVTSKAVHRGNSYNIIQASYCCL